MLLFGSVAAGEGTRYSDIDLLVVRRADVDVDQPQWLEQLAELEREAAGWTGNEVRIVEFGAGELDQGGGLFDEAMAGGVEIFGSRRSLRRAVSAEHRKRAWRRAEGLVEAARSRRAE